MTGDLRALAAEVGTAIGSNDTLARALGDHPEDASDAWNELGGALARQGNKGLAQRCFEVSAQANPASHKPLANLGSLALERGDAEEAAARLVAASELAPDNARILSKLGAALHRLGDLTGAAQRFDRSARLQPSWEALHNLGLCRAEAGDPSGALEAFEAALVIDPDAYPTALARARALLSVGAAEEGRAALLVCCGKVPPHHAAVVELLELLVQNGLFSPAASLSQAALERWPADEALLLVLVSALGALGDLTRAEPALRRAAPLAEGPGPLLHLARLHAERGERDKEIELLRQVAERFPERPEPRIQLAIALSASGRAEAALAILRPLADAPDAPLSVLGAVPMAELAIGDAARAMRAIRQAEALGAGPESFQTSIAVLTTNYVDDMTADEVADAHRRWAARAFPPVSPRPSARRRPGGRVRIGFASPDLREHSVGRFIAPVLRSLDRERFEVFCYSITARPLDAFTDRIRSLPLVFRDLRAQSIPQMLELIDADGVDVLFDLNGWMAEHKLELFHRRAAPVQIGYLGYPHTTGIAAMDYRISDAVADPPGSDRFYSEKLVRLPRSAWAFETDAPVPRPVGASRAPTFGCFNNLCKVTPTTLATWAAVLAAVPDARLLLKSHGLEYETARSRVIEALGSRGVDPARVELRGAVATTAEHLQMYAEVDVALDTFPYNGTTTTCEALFAGVPVVSMVGEAPASRVGASLLGAAGLEEVIAPGAQAYVEAAAKLATVRDVQSRMALREHVERSPLGDVRALTRAIEAAITEILGGRLPSPV
ncbi:MAG: tetratricopeptide repeat protein [Myxococcales bacterium]|nr:tetratricopeptide repeat protein [Myxococcales bacterium]